LTGSAVRAVAADLGELYSEEPWALRYSGRGLTRRRRGAARVTAWVQRNGVAAIFTLALIPNPIFDIADFAAGAMRMRPAH
jgi:uncharacterized membrane protein YdjX (TVP38/TMEM64 family)